MSKDTGKDFQATRRSFLKTGALAAAPLAAIVPAAALAEDGSTARLARLEDERVIEALHREWLRSASKGFEVQGLSAIGPTTIRSIAPDAVQEPTELQFAEDGQRAASQHACVVDLESPLEGKETFAQMARLQGNGTARRTESRIFATDYVRERGEWRIEAVRMV